MSTKTRNQAITGILLALLLLPMQAFASQDSNTSWFVPDWLAQAKYTPVFQVRDTINKYGRYAPQTKIIGIGDLIKYHGHFCGGVVEGACALKVGLDRLFPDGTIDRTDLEVVTKQSACGVDAAEFVTGTRTRFGSLRLGKGFKASQYILRRVSTGETVQVKVKKEVIPTEVRKQMKRIQSGKNSPADLDLFQKLQWAYAKRLVTRPLSESYDVTTLNNYVMQELQEIVEVGMQFHGHKCPAMPLGIRAGLAEMKVLSELTFVNKLRLTADAKTVCIPCSGDVA